MHNGTGHVLELILEDGFRQVRVACPPHLIPAPGQYLLASDGSPSPLPVPLFHTDSASQGGSMAAWRHFIASAPVPEAWNPGLVLHLRGPLGRGFALPLSARRVGLVAFEASHAHLKGLISPALKQGAAVVLVSRSNPDHLPDDVEVQPMSALNDVLEWGDYLAFDVARENLNQMREGVGKTSRLAAGKETQVLIHTPVPCGGIADCGVCAVTLRLGWKLACKDGPVFDWKDVG